MTNTIRYAVDADGIALLTIDLAGRSMNVITPELSDDLAALVEKVAADPAVKGAVITSGKSSFLAGADLKWIESFAFSGASAPELLAATSELSKRLRRLETCGKPFVAALNGTALGGGLEIGLACHYRVVADDPRIQLGLPEVKVGLLPGGGGTQRLPRLGGIKATIGYLLEGRSMSPAEALKLNAVHAVVPADQLIATAKAWILENGNPVQPWDEKTFKVPGGAGQDNAAVANIFAGAVAQVQKATLGNYPAPKAILGCVYEGVQVPLDAGLRIESRYFTQLLLDPVAGNLIRTTFINKQDADKLVRRPANAPAFDIKKVGILGSGMMGAGVAYVSAAAGLEVVLLDRTVEQAEKGKDYSRRLIEKQVKAGKMSAEKGEAFLARITATHDYDLLSGADLIIEAVFEDRAVKAEVTPKAEAQLRAGGIFASNTSTLPITGLAENVKHRDRFIGIHFFSPVDRMQLVEIIVGKETSDDTLAGALDYVKKIRKTPIVVNDSRGFYTSRCFGTFPKEGIAMLAEGITPALIEIAGRLAGMPVGSLAVADEVAIELVYLVKEAERKDLGDKYRPDPADPVLDLFVEKLKRVGRKGGSGFYDYSADGKELWSGLGDHFKPLAEQPALEEVKKRILYRQAVEAVRCYEENVITNPADGDIGALLGWGFAAYTGGPFSMIDTIGVETFVRELDRMTQAYGERFKTPEILRKMAAAGASFYPRSAAQAG